MMMGPHRGCILEDDPDTAAILREYVMSAAHEVRVVTTLAELRVALEEETFCYFLMDLQVPSDANARPLESTGETGIVTARKRWPEITREGWHVVPILVVTSYSRDPKVVRRMFHLKADSFIEKPLGDGPGEVLGQIGAALERGGCADHDACLRRAAGVSASTPAMATSASEGVVEGPLRLSITGETGDGVNFVLLGDRRITVQDQPFILLVKLLAAERRERHVWTSRVDLGIDEQPQTPYRLSKAFAGAMPEGASMVLSNRRKECQLNPLVEIGRVDWRALTKHGSAVVRKVAEQQLPRRRT